MSKITLITGGSRGIGAATARLAAARGHRVAIAYHRRRDAAEAVVESIRAAGGEPNRLERVCAAIPLGRAGEPEEVAEGILWLLDHASYSTGTFLVIAGGR